MAATKSEDLMDEPVAVELLAIFRGLQLCVPLGIPHLIVESDSLLPIQAVHEGETYSNVHHSNLIWDLRGQQRCFLSFKFQYVSRMGNKSTHKLARHAWQVEN